MSIALQRGNAATTLQSLWCNNGAKSRSWNNYNSGLPDISISDFREDEHTWSYLTGLYLFGNAPCGPGAIPSSPLSLQFPTSPPSTLFCSIFSFFPFLFSSCIFLLFVFSIPSHSTRVLPLRFHAGCRRRRLIVALVLFVLILCFMYV